MPAATQTAHRTALDARKRSSGASHFEEALREKVVGQEEAVQAIVDLYPGSGGRVLVRKTTLARWKRWPAH